MYLGARNSGNFEKAVSMTDSLLYLQSLIAEKILKKSIAGAQRDFYLEESEIEESKANELKMFLYAVGFIAVLIIAGIILFHNQRSKIQRMKLEANMTELMHLKEKNDIVSKEKANLRCENGNMAATIEGLRVRLDEKTDLLMQNSKVIEHLFKGQWKILNTLCNQYFNLSDSDRLRTVILNDIEKELNNLKSKKSLVHIEETVNRYMGGVMSMVRKQCSGLKEEDYTFMSLVYAGFSVRTICLMTGIKYKLFYLKRERLIRRISDSDAPNKTIFVEKLKNHSA